MKSAPTSGPNRQYPSWNAVKVAIGDKIIDAITSAVALSKADLATYRSLHSAWVAQHSVRGLAAWIHDRVWYHLTVVLADLPDVVITDNGVLREFAVGPPTEIIRFRVKRHDMDGDVSTYPTQLALDFLAQVEGVLLPGFSELHLIAGYRWDRDERSMGAAVISLRDGLDDIKWEVDLAPAAPAGATTGLPAKPKPSAPVIDSGAAGAKNKNSQGPG